MARPANPKPQYHIAGLPIDGGKMFYKLTGTLTEKTVYTDADLTIPHSQPVELDGNGFLPSVFFDGQARQILDDANDVQIFDVDPVGADVSTGAFTEWAAGVTYDVNALVEGSDGLFYLSIATSNIGNDPTSPSPTKWSQIVLVGVYNASDTYEIGNVIQDATGDLWRSVTNSNSGNTPSSDGGTNWLPAVSGSDIAEVAANTLARTTVVPQTGGGTLTAKRINQLRDGNTGYLLPLANSVAVDEIIEISLPDEFSALEPVVSRSGSDTIVDSAGSDTSITFDAGSISIRLTSDGASIWSL